MTSQTVSIDKAKSIMLCLIAFLLLFIIVEGLARIVSAYYIDKDVGEAVYVSPNQVFSPELGWELKPNFHGKMEGNVDRSFDSEGFVSTDTSKISDRSKPKVVFLGESSTFGFLIPTESTFVAITEKLVKNINSINLGVEGYTSFQGYQMLKKKGLEVNPDILVVSFNFNDRRYVLGKENVDSLEWFRELYKRHQQFINNPLRHLYIYRVMKYLFVKYGITFSNVEMKYHDEKIKVEQLRPRVNPENYRGNLIDIVTLAKSRGIDVILMILKDNPSETADLVKGIQSFENLHYDKAIEYLKVASGKNNVFRLLGRMYLEKTYRKIGTLDKAEAFSFLESNYIEIDGGLPIYLDSTYNNIMKEVAEQYNVELLDAGSVMEQYPSYYVDECHPNVEGHLKIASLLSERINKILLKRQLSRKETIRQ